MIVYLLDCNTAYCRHGTDLKFTFQLPSEKDEVGKQVNTIKRDVYGFTGTLYRSALGGIHFQTTGLHFKQLVLWKL